VPEVLAVVIPGVPADAGPPLVGGQFVNAVGLVGL
jgi:hypothetical protein